MRGYFLESVVCLLTSAFTYIAGDAASIIANGRPLYRFYKYLLISPASHSKQSVTLSTSTIICFIFRTIVLSRNHIGSSGLDIGLWQPLARGASESENPLAPQKTHWPPKTCNDPKMFSWREFMISRVKLHTFVH